MWLAITAILAKLDPSLPVRDVKALDEYVAATLSQQRFTMWLFVALAALAPIITHTAKAALGADREELGASAIALDLYATRHETQYTRLFRS